MNTLKKLTTPPWLALTFGIPALILMAALHLTGQDHRHLFVPGTVLEILLWILTAALVLLMVFSVQRYSGKAKFTRMFPPSAFGAAGILGAAIAVLWSAGEVYRSGAGVLELAACLLGLTAAASRFPGSLLITYAPFKLKFSLAFSSVLLSANPCLDNTTTVGLFLEL